MARVKTSAKGQYDSFVGEENEKEGEENVPVNNGEDEVELGKLREEEELETERGKEDVEDGVETQEDGELGKGNEKDEEQQGGKVEEDGVEEEKKDDDREEKNDDEEKKDDDVEEKKDEDEEEKEKNDDELEEKKDEEEKEQNDDEREEKDEEEKENNGDVEKENTEEKEEEEANHEDEEGGNNESEEEEANHEDEEGGNDETEEGGNNETEEGGNNETEEEEGSHQEVGVEENLEEEVEENTLAPMEQDTNDEDDESQPMQPERMFFPESEYTKMCTIGSRCVVGPTIKYVEKFEDDVGWFRNHPQFKHIFHMYQEPNHMAQGMWMLLLRTAETEMERECWFVVNGVPIRYSMREHALLTGLSCHEYPNKCEELGSTKFAEKVFGKCKGVTIKEVEAKVAAIKSNKSLVRKKLLILYFLFKVIKAKSRGDGLIDHFLLRVVDDVHACETFPWGRYTFEASMDGIRTVMKKMKGFVKRDAQTSFPGFMVPLEILAFECIPSLGQKFRKKVKASKDCPRMCKHMFSNNTLKGFSLDETNEALGDTQDIISILEPTSEEKGLLAEIVDEAVDDGIGFIDPIVDGWRERLIVQKKKIIWVEMFEKDVKARKEGCERVQNAEEVDVNATVSSRRNQKSNLPFKKAMEKGFQEVMATLSEIKGKVDDIDARLGELESTVKELTESEAREVPSGCVIYAPPLETPPRVPSRRKGQEDNLNEKNNGEEQEEEEEGEEGEKEDEKNEEDEEENGREIEKEEKRSKNKRKDKKKGKKKKKEKEMEVDTTTVLTTGKKRSRKPTKKWTPGEKKKRQRTR